MGKFVLLTLLCFTSAFASNSEVKDSELQDQVREAKSRYQDFWNRQKKQDLYEEQRAKGENEVRRLREQEQKKSKAALQAYKRSRPAPKDREKLRVLDDKARAEQRRQHEAFRHRYVQRKKILEKTIKPYQIPEDKELGLSEL